jgi:ubiquinone/menaquinone biosynthesis C-methylase UbiE
MVRNFIKNKIKKLPYLRGVINERERLREEVCYLKAKQEITTDKNRYAKDWNEYSRTWEENFGSKHAHLGDEWNDDGLSERKRDSFYFTAYAERFIGPDMSVMEMGPGGGKWTVRIAPKVKKLFALDVSEEMLKRTKERCDSEGITNMEYILSNGRDFQPIADESIDFFFSYDVFVHIALEDIWPYAQEIARVLAPGGKGICHYAINSTPEAWDRIEQNNDYYRFSANTLGQFYYYSPEVLRRMYERCGLLITEQHQESCYCTCIFEKPKSNIVPKMELLLKQLISQESNEEDYRRKVTGELISLLEQLRKSLDSIIAEARKEDDFYKRVFYAKKIRRMWRGM